MTRQTPETLLISAALTAQDPQAPVTMGVSPEMMTGYQDEYRWLITYERLYGSAPEVGTFRSKFPSFPYTETRDLAYAAEEVIGQHTHEVLIKTIRSASEMIASNDDSAAMSILASFAPSKTSIPLRNSIKTSSVLETYDQPVPSISVPFSTLQIATGGIKKGDVWYLAARLSNGKTFSLCNMAADALMDGKKVMFYSLEMSEQQMEIRLHVMLGARLGIEVDHVGMRDRTFNRIAYRRLLDEISERVTGELYIHDSSKQKVSPLHIAANGRDFDLNIVDYVGLMHSSSGGRAVDDWRTMASISNQLKEVAIAANTRIIAAAQINREGDTIGWKPPKTKNLAQSDALGQDADVVITQKKFGKSALVYLLDKNRHGESGQIFFSQFYPNTGRFTEITRNEAELLREEDDSDD